MFSENLSEGTSAVPSSESSPGIEFDLSNVEDITDQYTTFSGLPSLDSIFPDVSDELEVASQTHVDQKNHDMVETVAIANPSEVTPEPIAPPAFSYEIVEEETMCVDNLKKERNYGECWKNSDNICEICTCYDRQDVRCTKRTCLSKPSCQINYHLVEEMNDGCCSTFRCVKGKNYSLLFFSVKNLCVP